MTVILSHIGNELPSYIFVCINQIRKFFAGKIILVTNSSDFDLLSNYDIEIFNPNFDDEKYEIAKTVNFYTYPSVDFWLNSLCRLFFIEQYTTKNKTEEFIIFENDVLIYSDLKTVFEKFSKTYNNIGITIRDKRRITTGFSFFKSYKDLIRLNYDIISLINDKKKMEDINTNYAPNCPSEMVFLRKISKEKKYIEPLPLFPNDKNIETIGFIFDPADYGQFLGGTPSVYTNSKSSFIDDTTYIGKKLKEKIYNVFFDDDEKKPFLVDKDGKRTPIFNLHIHSKNLNNFV